MPSKSEPQTLAHNYEYTSRPRGEDIYILTRTPHSINISPTRPCSHHLGDLLLNSFIFCFSSDPGRSRSSCKKAMERNEKRFCIRLV